MEVMALPLRLFLSAHSLFSSRAQTLIVVSIRDDNFQLDFMRAVALNWNEVGRSRECLKAEFDNLQTLRKADVLCDAAGIK